MHYPQNKVTHVTSCHPFQRISVYFIRIYTVLEGIVKAFISGLLLFLLLFLFLFLFIFYNVFFSFSILLHMPLYSRTSLQCYCFVEKDCHWPVARIYIQHSKRPDDLIIYVYCMFAHQQNSLM